ncbi:MAG: hypothetical protein KBS74_06765 [Clostridiales bacterium]|nr:hypothetical protein [Candidatus Cacconaster stercorequi]
MKRENEGMKKCRKCIYRNKGRWKDYGCNHMDVAGVSRLLRGKMEGYATVDKMGTVHFPVEDCPFWRDTEIWTRDGIPAQKPKDGKMSKMCREKKKRGLAPEKVTLIVELLKSGAAYKEIAQKARCSVPTICKVADQHGLKRRAEYNHEKTDAERIELWKQGMTDGQIAEKLGLTRKAIWSWRTERGLARNEEPVCGGKK